MSFFPSILNFLGITTPGQVTSAGSFPVVLASDQSTLNVAVQGTQTISGTVTANQGTANSAANGWPVKITDGTNTLGTGTNPVRTDPTGTTTQPVSGTVTANAGTGTFTVAGGKTNNNAAPGATNVGSLTAIANAAQPTNTEGNQTLISQDLKGNQRARIQDAAGNDRGVNVTSANAALVDISASTANSTAGLVSVKIDQTTDGTTNKVAATQATAANLNATVVGTGTFAVQATLATETTKVIGTVNQGTSPWVGNTTQIVGTAIDVNSGNKSNGTQRLVLATDQPALTTAGVISAKIDQTTPGTTNAISIAQVGANTVVTGGANGSLSVGGTVAQNTAITQNPIIVGGSGVSAEPTAVTTTRSMQWVGDLYGKQIVSPHAGRDNFVKGSASTTGTSDTSVVAAAGASLKNYITNISTTNTGSTTALITIKDGSGGSTLWQTVAPAGGGSNVTLEVPIAGTANTAVFFAAGSSSTTVYCSMSGYKGA